jgi:uncharacterized membrane protein
MKISEEQQNEWYDDQYWKAGLFYYNKEDKRILPPKRYGVFGWTVNFANPFSYGAFFLLMLLVIVGVLYIKHTKQV